MTPYHFDNKKNKQKHSLIRVTAVVFAVVVGILGIVFLLAPLITRVAQGPAWLARSAERFVETGITALTPKSIILERYYSVKEKANLVDVYQSENVLLRSENELLRKELSYTQSLPESITAGVVVKPGQSLFNRIIIDQGLDDGIREGQMVVAAGSVALGRISEVTQATATVDLFSGPWFDDSLTIIGQNISVPAKGNGGGNFEIHIPREIPVADNDVLVLPYNTSLMVGIVKSVTFDPRDPFQTILARTPVNIQELRFVQVLKN